MMNPNLMHALVREREREAARSGSRAPSRRRWRGAVAADKDTAMTAGSLPAGGPVPAPVAAASLQADRAPAEVISIASGGSSDFHAA